MTSERVIIIGGAGFIGSHFCDRLLATPGISAVTVFDNFSSGREWHIAHHSREPRFSIVRDDVRNLPALMEAMRGHDTVIHLASNPDIARAVVEPTIDFDSGTLLTSNVLEAMRRVGVKRILYASGSGVFGETGTTVADEDYSPMVPISTYGASKLAGEALISAYAHMFALTGVVFRFGNVVGNRQTHGVGFDFIRRLRSDPHRLRILGNGRQIKSYIHVDDVVSGVLHANAHAKGAYTVFNLATGDTMTVKEIADLACEVIGLDPATVAYEFTGGDRGWKGDVPVVLLDIKRIEALGWRCEKTSHQAMRQALVSLLEESKRNLI